MKSAMLSFGTTGKKLHRRATRAQKRESAEVVFAEPLEHRLLFASYNAVSDFSLNSNPNGVWSYGETSSAGFVPDPGANMTNSQWQGAGTGSTTSAITLTPQTQALEMRPGQGGASADLRWTAPGAGTFSITGAFTDNTGRATSDVHVNLNGASLASAEIGFSGVSTLPINQTSVTVKAGDNVDFIVGPGPDGYDSLDQVALTATISTVGPTGSNGSPLSPSVSGKLPTKTLIAGQKVTPFFQFVTLTNTGTSRITGPVTIDLVLGNSSTGETGDPSVASLSRRISLAANKSIKFPLLIRALPANSTGQFFLVANVTDPTGLTSTGGSSGTITVAPPRQDLTGAFGRVPLNARLGRNLLLPVVVTNSGNVQAKGMLEIDIIATSNTATVDLGPITKRIVINPQRRQFLELVAKFPANAPAATYTLTGTVDPNHVFNDPTITNNTFASPTPVTVRA